jgi:ribosomal subunit interface protein
MQKKILFHGFERTPVIDRHIEEHTGKIERFLAEENSPKHFDVTLEFNQPHQFYRVTARVKSPHFDCFAEHEGPDVNFEIKEVLERLHEQLRVTKEKWVDRQKHGCSKGCHKAINEKIEIGLDIDDDIEG